MKIQTSDKTTRSEVRRLSVVFCVSTLGYGGAETLLENLVCRLDPRRFAVAICCTKTLGPIGRRLQSTLPIFEYRMQRKWDVRIVRWMKQRLQDRQADIVITVGAGDKMFWGRLAAWRAGVPVVISALHTTGWPDEIGRLNRLLTPINDAFVGVAASHGKHLVEKEKLPTNKVHVISNGIDVHRYRPQTACHELRESLGIPSGCQLVGIVARLGAEKNHEMFFRVAHQVHSQLPNTHFLVVGDGPRRQHLEALADELEITRCVHFTGARADVPQLLSLLDVFLLTSHNEASPVSVLEAMSSGIPVITTNVGSLLEIVIDGNVGYLVPPGDDDEMILRTVELLRSPDARATLGQAARQRVINHWSVDTMVHGYERLMLQLWSQKSGQPIENITRHDNISSDDMQQVNLIDV